MSWHCATKLWHIVKYSFMRYETNSLQSTVNSISMINSISNYWSLVWEHKMLIKATPHLPWVVAHRSLFVNIFSCNSPPVLAYSHLTMTYLPNTFRTSLCIYYVWLPRLIDDLTIYVWSVPCVCGCTLGEFIFLVRLKHIRFDRVENWS